MSETEHDRVNGIAPLPQPPLPGHDARIHTLERRILRLESELAEVKKWFEIRDEREREGLG